MGNDPIWLIFFKWVETQPEHLEKMVAIFNSPQNDRLEASEAETISDGQVGTQPWLPSLVLEGLYLGNMWIVCFAID